MLLSTLPPGLRPAALVSLLLLGACSSKNDNGAAPITPTTYGSSWTGDGQSYTATSSFGQVNNTTLNLGLAQTATSGDGVTISMSVPAATGNYNLGNGSNLSTYTTTVGGTSTTYVVSSGTVMVTTLSATEIIGTFSFTASNFATPAVTKTITNGKFAIKR